MDRHPVADSGERFPEALRPGLHSAVQSGSGSQLILPRPDGEWDRVLCLVRQALVARAKQGDGALERDPVSALNLALQGSFKPKVGENRPLDFEFIPAGADFQCTVVLCGLRMAGPVQTRKDNAKRQAAAKAIQIMTSDAAS
mmetsp:Transcript_53391/g.135489  ORF Transcript_53391/g.135489 Transcript_53391/m.135489 type:complete len:142 (-) Transcript_53391:44-469(-)